MDIQNVIIRPMEKGEEKTVAKVGKKAFQFIEALFVGSPKKAMVADYQGKIIGAIIYKFLDTKKQQIIYIDEAFVDPEYHGMGVGKKLYTETFYYLQEWGCDVMTALVKDDNVASWKPFIENGFRRVALRDGIKTIGVTGMLKQYFCTPFFIAVGMDFYILYPEKPVAFKPENPLQLLYFLFGNLLLALPMWILLFQKNAALLLPYGAAYLTLLVLILLTRCIGGLCSGEKYHFRLNNGGGLLTAFLSYWGNLFPMNANWYPVSYRDTDEFRRKLALPELVKWAFFLFLPLLAFTTNIYLNALASLSCVFLVFLILPFYPFETYGAGRIYRYKKGLWFMTAVITIAQLIVVSHFAG